MLHRTSMGSRYYLPSQTKVREHLYSSAISTCCCQQGLIGKIRLNSSKLGAGNKQSIFILAEDDLQVDENVMVSRVILCIVWRCIYTPPCTYICEYIIFKNIRKTIQEVLKRILVKWTGIVETNCCFVIICVRYCDMFVYTIYCNM